MLSLPLCPTPGVRACIVLGLTLLIPAVTLSAAESSGEPAGARGQLKDAPRSLTPEVADASDEARLALGSMKLPPGLQAHLWAAEPMLANPVAFNLDEQGRVFVAETHRYRTSVLDIRDYMWTLEDELDNRTQEDFVASIHRNFGETGVAALSRESERLMLLEDTDGDGAADKSSVYADNFRSPIDGIASGVLAHRGAVWFTNIPALWKFTGEAKAETRTELLRGFGLRFNFTGHDFHGLVLGPDGRLYFSIGDRGASVPTKEGGRVESPDTGSVFRCWPDGTGLELFATGLRNPQSLLFNEYGDLFTGDNDSDQGDEERLVHVVEGGDSGWRIGYQFAPRGNAGPWNAEQLWHPRHAGQPAYLVPPICNIEDGPSGIAYYPGTGLTPDYAGRIFITHFKGSISNSGIFTYRLKPAGASYAIADAAPFLTGALPTDVRFGPDGKLYYSDWAEGWPKSRKGRIYTISDPARVNDPLVQSTRQLIAGDWTKRSGPELTSLLAHPDWRVRLEAQYTLADRGPAGVPALTAIAGESDGLARLHAVWALGQIAHHDATATSSLRRIAAEASAEARAQALKALGDLRDAASGPIALTALSDASARVRFQAAITLGKLGQTDARTALVEAVQANANVDATLRHALVLGLAGCASPEQLSALAAHPAAAVRLAAVLALRRTASPLIAAFLADPDAAIVREAALAINDAPIPAAYPALAALAGPALRHEAVQLRVLNAHFRLGTPADAAALATFAAGPAPADLRQEALDLLTLWPTPPARDRIVGVYQPLPAADRPAADATTALAPHLAGLFTAPTPDNVQLAAINVISTLGFKAAAPGLQAVVADPAGSGSVRAAALRALDGFDVPGLVDSAAIAADSDSPELRLAALAVVSRLTPETAVAQLTKLIASGTTPEQQAAYRALGTAPDPTADDLILAQLTALADGRVPPAAQLDLLEAAGHRDDPRIKQALADREAALAANPDPLAPFRVTLEGGNPRNARTIIYGNPVVQCIRCHRIGESGAGDAGPNLGGIGARASREYILESLIKPSAKFADGYETVSVTKTNGETLIGTLLMRDAQGLQVRAGDADPETIAAGDIKQVESAPSGMPEVVGLVLSKTEIRDLIAYLAGLQEPLPTGPRPPMRALRPVAP